MWTDLNSVDSTPFKDRYDVCICGSGPAGIATALRLMNKGARVLLLEAGGLDYSDESQAVYVGQSVGMEYFGLEQCRLRYFGGTSNHWTGLCGLFSPLDFSERKIWGMPGWPISFSEAYREIDDAISFLDLQPQEIKVEEEAPAGIAQWKYKGVVPYAFGRSSPTRVGEKFGPSLKTANNVDVAYNANVTDVKLSEDGRRATALTVRNYKGAEYSVNADYFVLALGGMENARFLLSARSQAENGVGNQNDMVGRCFMEHFQYFVGRFVSSDNSFWREGETSWQRYAGKYGRWPMRLSDSVMDEKEIGSFIAVLAPNAKPYFGGRLKAFREIRNKMVCSSDYLLEMVRANNDVICEGDGSIANSTEQMPNKDSRIFLDEKKTDRFGKPKIVLDWRLSEQDRYTIRHVAEELGKALAAEGVARLRISEDILEGGDIFGLRGHNHHMGTTRMSVDPKDGVVDVDSKIHNMDNLYVAGSSVFSTGSSMNPTFTIVALSLRLGEHLSHRLGLN